MIEETKMNGETKMIPISPLVFVQTEPTLTSTIASPILQSKKKYRVHAQTITDMIYEVEACSPEAAKQDACGRAKMRLHRGRVDFKAQYMVDTPQEL